jgi:hypothetical protein
MSAKRHPPARASNPSNKQTISNYLQTISNNPQTTSNNPQKISNNLQTTFKQPFMPQKNKRKEAIVLIAVALVGAVGLWVLQRARGSETIADEQKSLIQAAGTQAVNSAEGLPQSNIQKIPGDILHEDKPIELNKPFLYELSNFSTGAVYELDLGDGHKKTFNNGTLTHIYTGSATEYVIKLYATYNGQTELLKTIVKPISKKVQNVVANPKTGKAILDEED